MVNSKKFAIGINILFIFLWGVVTLSFLICDYDNPESIAFLCLYLCYVITKCDEIKYISEVDRYDD